MAKPPDGQSAWFHHADSYRLPDADGRAWALVVREIAAPRLEVSFAIAGQEYDFFHCLQLEVDGAGVRWTLHHELLREPHTAIWRPATDAAALLPHARVRQRTTRWDRDVERPIVAQLSLDGPGRLAVLDGAGARRVEIALAECARPPRAPSAVFQLPTDPAALVVALYGDVAAGQSSLP